jgi:hypothetical protein
MKRPNKDQNKEGEKKSARKWDVVKMGETSDINAKTKRKIVRPR